MIENRVPDAGATRVVPHNGQYTPFPYSAIPLDLRGMRGAMGANYAESLYLKEANAHAQHQLVRPLPSAGKVTSSYRTYDQSPINLVQKEAPPAPDNFNYYSLQSAYLNGHPPYTPYPIPFNNPYLPVPGTPTKSTMKFMDTAPPILTVPSSPVKTSVDVKNAPPQFKVPLKTRPTPYSRPKRNSGPPPIPVPRPVEEIYPEIANILANSKDIPESEDELKRFHKGSCVWSQGGIKNVSVSEEELKFFIEKDLARRVEQSTEDFIVSGVSNSSRYNLYLRTVVAIRENKESGKVILTLMCEKGDKTWCEKPTAYPFFVSGRGWCSYSPEEMKKALGWCGGQLREGDVLLSISEKEPSNDAKKPSNVRVEPQQNGHHESKVSPYKNDLKSETRSNNTNSSDFNHCSRQEDNRSHSDSNKNSSEDSSEASRNKMRRWSAPDPCIEKYR